MVIEGVDAPAVTRHDEGVILIILGITHLAVSDHGVSRRLVQIHVVRGDLLLIPSAEVHAPRHECVLRRLLLVKLVHLELILQVIQVIFLVTGHARASYHNSITHPAYPLANAPFPIPPFYGLQKYAPLWRL